MNTTNLPVRRTTSAVAVATAVPTSPPPVRRRRIGLFEVLAIAAILILVAGLMLSLAPQPN